MTDCKFPNGIVIKPDGVNELDPCVYETKKIYTNCVVEVAKCKNCGKISISWCRTSETKELDDDFELITMILRGDLNLED